MALFANLAQTVGDTPLLELSRLASHLELPARLLGKLELRNPSGSVKDRAVVHMIQDAEARGTLRKGMTLVEATSGNTGIALASAAAALGYKLVITMPESMSKERIAMLKMLGAEVILTSGTLMGEAVAKAKAIVKQRADAIMLEQFENPANPKAHEEGTAMEIWQDCGGVVDAFVAGVGTGGTLCGVGRALKGKRETIQVIAVEPATCAVLSGKRPGPHYIQGIGAGFVPKNVDREVIDEVLLVDDKQAMKTAVQLARTEGILAGISSGANLFAAAQVALRPEMKGKTIVTVICDSGERYLSTPLLQQLSD